MYDADEPGRIVNEFLVTIFVPGILTFVGLFAAFRIVLDGVLSSYGLRPIAPASGGGAIAAGYGRMLLLILLTAALLLPYLVLYARFLRKPLRHRGIV